MLKTNQLIIIFSYSKLIKSKNLSQCSQKDLISIFPKKQPKNNNYLREETTNGENTSGTFDSTSNINDYFKSKMDKLKLKHKLNANNFTKVDEIPTEEQKMIFEEKGVSFEDNTSQSVERKSEKLNESAVNSKRDSNPEFNVKPEKHQKPKKKNKRIKEEMSEFNSDIVESSSNNNFEFQSLEQNVIKTRKTNKKHFSITST